MKYIVVRKLYLFNVYLARVMMLRRKRKNNEMRNELKQTQKFQTSACNDYQTWLADKRCWLEFRAHFFHVSADNNDGKSFFLFHQLATI